MGAGHRRGFEAPSLLTLPGDLVYRALLHALPAQLRREVGADLAELFRAQRRVAARRPWSLPGLWLAAVRDVLHEGHAERRSLRAGPGAPRQKGWRRLPLAEVGQGLRLVRRSPAASMLAVATLALGIGANTAIFSLVDAVLIRALPYRDPSRLVMVAEKRPAEGRAAGPVSPADYLDWRRMNEVFESMAAFVPTAVSLSGDGDAVQVPAAAVGWSFFEMLGVRPEVGRTFTAADEVYGQHHVVLISHALWQQRYGADPQIAGRYFTLGGNDTWQIIGVLPADFRFVSDYDVWAPLVLEVPGQQPASRVLHQLDVYARLRPELGFEQAVDAMDRLGGRLEQEHPDENEGHGARVMSMQEHYVEPVRRGLVFLFAAIGLVLLIACVNVANLLLARAAVRHEEMAVRSALGASRARLIVLALVESVAFGLGGGALGLGLAELLLRAFPALLPERMSVVTVADLHLDARLLAFAFGLSLATGVAVGLIPALQGSRPRLRGGLGTGRRPGAGAQRGARRALVVCEVALATLTLVGAGLVLRSFAQIMAQPLGFDPAGRLVVRLSMPSGRYTTPEARRDALAELEGTLGTIPGVHSIGAIDLLPLSGEDSRSGVAIEGREPEPDDPPTRMHRRVVTPGYFETMEIPVLEGRGFVTADDQRAEPVVIVSRMSGRRFWPGESPVGWRVRFGGDDTWRTVVGVAGDVRHWGLTEEVNPVVYQPQAQSTNASLAFILRGDVAPLSLTGAVRARVEGFDANLPVAEMRTLDEVVADSTRGDRALTVLMGGFGALALLLAVVGIYGVTAQLVALRVPEIGVRMAIGARPADIRRQLMAESLRQMLAGLAIGLIAGAWLMRFGEALLYGVAPADPLTLVAVSAQLLLAGVAATVVPVRRAMRVDPVTAIRGG